MDVEGLFARSAEPPRAAVSLRLAPLGLPLRIDAETPELAACVEAACVSWRGAKGAAGAGLRIALRLDPGLRGTGEARIEVAGREMGLAGPGVAGRALADERRAHAAVSPDYLAAPLRLLDEVLEPLALFLLARNGRTPVHAAGFVIGGVPVVAAGPSGSGKSCLALAADAAGWPVLSDDTVYLDAGPEPRLWGWPGAVHLLPADCPGGSAATRLRNGRLKHAVAPLNAVSAPVCAVDASLCILVHGQNVALEPLSPREALRRLAPLEPGFDLLTDEIAAAHAFLARNGAWLLTLSPRPPEAIALLARTLR